MLTFEKDQHRLTIRSTLEKSASTSLTAQNPYKDPAHIANEIDTKHGTNRAVQMLAAFGSKTALAMSIRQAIINSCRRNNRIAGLYLQEGQELHRDVLFP